MLSRLRREPTLVKGHRLFPKRPVENKFAALSLPSLKMEMELPTLMQLSERPCGVWV